MTLKVSTSKVWCKPQRTEFPRESAGKASSSATKETVADEHDATSSDPRHPVQVVEPPRAACAGARPTGKAQAAHDLSLRVRMRFDAGQLREDVVGFLPADDVSRWRPLKDVVFVIIIEAVRTGDHHLGGADTGTLHLRRHGELPLEQLCHTRGADSEGGPDRMREGAQLAVAFFK